MRNMELTIFYSWQAKTEEKQNRYYIKKCIEKAYKDLQKNTAYLTFKLLDSIEHTSGSVAVASTIMDERIPNCDIFISDLSVTDPYSAFEKVKNFFCRTKCRDVHQANNVMIEYGIAYNSIGKDSIIGVLNKDYGSPNDNADNIPFDIRHLRFPIEYQYKKNEKDFINALKNAINLCAKTAIENRKNKFSPFKSWYEYRNYRSNQSIFYKNTIIDSILTEIRGTTKDIRFLGLSGLGKTRIVFESYNEKNENAQFNWLYCDFQINEEYKIQNSLDKLFGNANNYYTIVLDNCPLFFFRRVLRQKFESGNKSKIISIYNRPEEEYDDKIGAVHYISLSINDLDSVVDNIIECEFTDFSEQQRKTIKEFSEGIPLMAVLLAENIKVGNDNYGILSDKDLLYRLLYIESETEKEILKSCSLFKYIGYSEDLKKQIDYIITDKNLTPIQGDDAIKLSNFEKVFLKYKRREIFEINGRLFSIRPRPLAFHLASEWIEQCLQDRIEKIIDDFRDPKNNVGKSLIEPLCDQIRFLGYNPKAQLIIKHLTGADSPFHNAEVINTELGSRLFRSFVEVNPVAVADCLWGVFNDMSTEQLFQIEEGRRNLVWTLEKICFDKRTYEKGMKLMMMFGTAENETLGNNAANVFTELFKIYLPGTQASLSERLDLLKWGISQESYKGLCIQAIKSALQSQHFSYMCGAENQGTKKLEHYQPKNGKEILDYWDVCINILYSEIINDTDFSDECCKILVQSISGLCRTGAAHISLPIIKEICTKKDNDWDEMLDNLCWVKKHSASYMEPQWVEYLLDLINILTKKDFVSRFNAVEKLYQYTDEKLSFEQQVGRKRNEYEKLANEYVEKEINNISVLSALYQIDNGYSHPFGYTIAKLNEGNPDKIHCFIHNSIKCFYSLDKYNPSILFSFVRGLCPEDFTYLVSIFEKDEKCSSLLFPILANHGTSLSETNILFNLVENGVVSVEHFIDFWRYTTILATTSDKEIIDFFTKIIKCDKNGFNIIITLLNNSIFFNKDRNFENIADFVFSELQSKNIAVADFLENNDYLELIEKLLIECNIPQLAVFINNIIIKASKDPKKHISSDWRIEHIYKILLDKYFMHISQDLLSALVSDNPFSILSLQFLFEHKEYSDLSHIFFQEKNTNIILDFCKQSSVAQERIMRIVPAIQDGKFSPVVMELLNNYGNNEAMLDSLSANIGSFSCVGSLIPLYESRKKVLSSLLSHSNSTIVSWTKRKINQLDKDIENEKKRESEDKLLYS